jgi:hypothetical protein
VVADDPVLGIRGVQVTTIPVPKGAMMAAFEGESRPYEDGLEDTFTPDEVRFSIGVANVDSSADDPWRPLAYTIPAADDIAHMINQECMTNTGAKS